MSELPLFTLTDSGHRVALSLTDATRLLTLTDATRFAHSSRRRPIAHFNWRHPICHFLQMPPDLLTSTDAT